MEDKQILLQIPATIGKIQTLEDKTLKVDLTTQELTSEEKATLFSLHEKFGWFLFSEQVIKEQDIIDLPEIENGDVYDKPDHIRLSNIFWRIVEQQKGRKPTEVEFREYYHKQYAFLIDRFKEKLNP